jgi:tetratricopeptide (TPR) repeat protein
MNCVDRKVSVRNVTLFAVCMLTLMVVRSVSSCPLNNGPGDYPLSLAQDLKKLLDANTQNSSDPSLLISLSSLYLDLGNDLYTDPEKRLSAHKEGARLAQHALELQKDNAEAHFLYAAHLGEAADLRGIAASLLSLEEMRMHLRRALDLQKDHVPALHMAGMLLEGLPRFMGGNPDAALDYLKRAVTLDPTYTEARLDLAKLYVKRNKGALAIPELQGILKIESPRDAYAWSHQHCPEAQHLLDSLQEKAQK